MRLFTFSFLRRFKYQDWYQSSRTIGNNSTIQLTAEVEKKSVGDPSLVEVLPSWLLQEQTKLREQVLQDICVIPNFVTEQEEASLLAELEPYLKRMRYEYDHWDNAIEGYRETERSSWNESNSHVLSRVRAIAFNEDRGEEPLPHQHVLDLAAAGFIRPHVDAVRFCGGVITGLCLLSDAVMRLRHSEHQHLALDALLVRRGLYIMRGVARYDFSHEVLGGTSSQWAGVPLHRQRRVAVITRSQPPPQKD